MAKDEATDRQAKADYEIAIAADPDFALAHAALSRSLSSIAAAYAKADELKGIYAQAIDEAKRATAIAPTLAEGHLALGYALFSGRLDVRAQGRPTTRPTNMGAAMRTSSCSARLTWQEPAAFGGARRNRSGACARPSEPPHAPRCRGHRLCIAPLCRCVTQARRALELNPKISNANAAVGDSLMLLGKLPEARAAYLKEPSAMFRLRGLAALEHRAGNQAAADRALSQLISDVGDAAMYQQAEVMAQWGNRMRRWRSSQRARVIGDSGLTMIATDPLLDPIASDQRFTRLVKDLGFG